VPATKFCDACETDKPRSEFHIRRKAADGLQAHCKVCRCEQVRLWRLRAKARNAAVKHAWYEANVAHVSDKMRDWRIENPEKSKAIYHRRYGRRQENFVEDVDRDVVFARDEGLCGICGRPVDPQDWHLDHAIPLAAGGEHSYANVQVSHPRCNRRKGTRLDMPIAA
jgi:hypothetical protein